MSESPVSRMTPERIESVIEEIVTIIRDFGNDAKGLHTISFKMIRPDGLRTSYINYTPEDSPHDANQ